MSSKAQKGLFYGLVILISAVLTLLAIYQRPVFNPDGFIYIEMAKTYLQHGMLAAAKAFNWPFYPMLIAWVSQLTQLSFLHAAYLINGIFSTLTVVLFILLMREFTENQKLLWLAAFVILAFHPFNNYRDLMVRGHGYWFFFLLSFLFLVRFGRTLSWQYAVLWALSISVATLFRIEGVVFLILSPFVVFAFKPTQWRERFYAYVKLNCLNILYAAALIPLYIFYFHANPYYLDSIPNVMDKLNFLYYMPIVFHYKAMLFTKYIVPSLGTVNSIVVLLVSLLATYILLIMEVVTLAYVICVIQACRHRLLKAPMTHHLVLWFYVGINIFITGVFYLQNMYLSERYLIPLALLLLIYVPFGLADLYERFRHRPKRFSAHSWLFPLVCLLILAMIIGSIYRFGPNKRYIYEAGQWIQQHSPASARVYTNEKRVLFYAARKGWGWDFHRPKFFRLKVLNKKPWRGYSYVAIALNKEHSHYRQQVIRAIGVKPIKVFYYKRRQDQLLIFELRQEKRK